MVPRTAIVGAGGYVGDRLLRHLTERDQPVLVLGQENSRSQAERNVEWRPVSTGDQQAMTEALRGVGVVYHLVSTIPVGRDFAARNQTFARTLASAAARANVGRIVYLDDLGNETRSDHPANYHKIGAILAGSGVPTVELRSAGILGAGSIIFEILRYLTERLPVMICPQWVQSTLRPLAETDLLAYLTRATTVEPGGYEIGGPDQVSYLDLIRHYARARGLPARWIRTVGLRTPRLSAHWVGLVTPIDHDAVHALIERLTGDPTTDLTAIHPTAVQLMVRDRARTGAAFAVRPMGADEAIRVALDKQAERVADQVLDFSNGLVDGVYALRSQVELDPDARYGAELDLQLCGGDLDWYGVPWLWRARLVLGRAFGEKLRLHRPEAVVPGARVDWWTVRRHTPNTLVLETREWFCGEAWLAYRITEKPRQELQQVGALRARGLVGWAYWRVLWLIHIVVFWAMARRQADRARMLARHARHARHAHQPPASPPPKTTR